MGSGVYKSEVRTKRMASYATTEGFADLHTSIDCMEKLEKCICLTTPSPLVLRNGTN